MPTAIRLIVGLGNPGSRYEKTRHNVGAWFVKLLAEQFHAEFKAISAFKAQMATIQCGTQSVWLALPTTYMNESGISVQAISAFYQITPQEILVAHDELDFPAGTVRLKSGGGHGGHNGLRSLVEHLPNPEFQRLRIGIGHPGHRDLVHDYVLGRPSLSDTKIITEALADAAAIVPRLITGDLAGAMQELHTLRH